MPQDVKHRDPYLRILHHILIVKRDSKENDHEFSVRQYSDSDLVRAIRIQLGMDR